MPHNVQDSPYLRALFICVRDLHWGWGFPYIAGQMLFGTEDSIILTLTRLAKSTLLFWHSSSTFGCDFSLEPNYYGPTQRITSAQESSFGHYSALHLTPLHHSIAPHRALITVLISLYIAPQLPTLIGNSYGNCLLISLFWCSF